MKSHEFAYFLDRSTTIAKSQESAYFLDLSKSIYEEDYEIAEGGEIRRK